MLHQATWGIVFHLGLNLWLNEACLAHLGPDALSPAPWNQNYYFSASICNVRALKNGLNEDL